MYQARIRQNPLFSDLDENAFHYALHYFRATQKQYKKGEILNRIGETLPWFGLVLSGVVRVSRDDMDGNSLILATVTPGETFGESLNFLALPADIYITALTPLTVLQMNTDRIKNPAPRESALDRMLSNRFTATLATRALRMNDRIQVLSKITLREKLIALFSPYVHTFGNAFTLPFSREDMAVYLGVNRSALSRELSKMREEGILDFDRAHIRIKK